MVVDEDIEASAVWVPPVSLEEICHLSLEPLIGLVYLTAEPASIQIAVPPEFPLVGVVVAGLLNWVKLTMFVTVGVLESDTV